MKLTRDQLLHATDNQLTAIGIARKNNSGWLKTAECTEYTREQIEYFERVGLLRRHRPKRAPKEHADLFSQKPEKPYDNSAEREINDIYLANRAEFD